MVMKFLDPYISDRRKLSELQRRLLVHNFLYYDVGEPVISDESYEELSNQYLNLVESADETEFKKSRYYNAFRIYDGSTGYYLTNSIPEHEYDRIKTIAYHVLKIKNGE